MTAAGRCRNRRTEPNPNKTSFRLPFTFMFTGMFCLIAFQALAFRGAADLASGMPRSPGGWSAAHLLALGWAAMIAMGAVYQLIHVVLNKKIFSEALGFVHYSLFAGGMAALVLGFLVLKPLWLMAGGVMSLAGIAVFIVNMAVTLLRARQWNPITLHVASALCYLLFVAGSGLAMGFNFRFGFMQEMHERLLAAHIWAGFVGWFTLLIVGFSYKMLPMFYLAHNYPVRLQYVTLALFNIGLTGMMAALLAGAPFAVKWLALAVIAAATVAYNTHVSQIIRRKHKAKPGAGIAFSVWLIRGLSSLLSAALLLLAIFPHLWNDGATATVFAYLFFLGWIALTIFGYLSKIAPFLWWTHKYGSLVGKEQVPSLADMIDERKVKIGLAAMLAGIAAVAVGLAAQSYAWVLTAQALLSVCMLFYISLVLNVFRK